MNYKIDTVQFKLKPGAACSVLGNANNYPEKKQTDFSISCVRAETVHS